ncbi:MAG: hypothetical protein KF749_07300 [Bacteroidetes bacterium]|nr:hypothetical protein [Bacteroidota bacterium]MCW5896578.1 hypothetical protein [Bacteroidota bacterium]
MKARFVEHAVSILLVTALFAGLIHLLRQENLHTRTAQSGDVQKYVALEFVDFGNPLDRALFRESLNIFHPEASGKNDSLLRAIDDFRREQFTNELYKTGGGDRGLTAAKAQDLLGMYLQFIVIYIVVLALSYYGAQTLGTIRFVQMKQGRSSYLETFFDHLSSSGNRSVPRAAGLLVKALVKGMAYVVLFAPAYVIAYSFKTRFDTDSYIFMILLGVISNGLLINYTNRFFTFLVAESRKGYVETAVVKNLYNSYAWHAGDGISKGSIFRLRKRFPSHVFQHIYLNARHQFQPTLKEHASFLITGLVIIEMALNIQGHLSYEMLKNILYKQYDVVLAIVLSIFLLVKATEIAVDLWSHRQERKFGNKQQ